MRGQLADRPRGIEHGLVNGQQFRGLEQFVHALQQFVELKLLQFVQFLKFLNFLQLLKFLQLFHFFQFVKLDGLVIQFWRRIQFELGELILQFGFVRRLWKKHEALGVD